MKILKIVFSIAMLLIPILFVINIINFNVTLILLCGTIIVLFYIFGATIETTKHNKIKKTDLMTCPHCGSIDAKLLAADTDCEYPEWTYKCKDCGTEWTEYAELKYAGYHLKE